MTEPETEPPLSNVPLFVTGPFIEPEPMFSTVPLLVIFTLLSVVPLFSKVPSLLTAPNPSMVPLFSKLPPCSIVADLFSGIVIFLPEAISSFDPFLTTIFSVRLRLSFMVTVFVEGSYSAFTPRRVLIF